MAEVLQTLFSGSWTILNGFKYPGTNISLAAIFFGSAVAVISLNLLGNIFGFTFGGSIGRIGRAVHGGNNKNIKVSDSRKGDTK